MKLLQESHVFAVECGISRLVGLVMERSKGGA